MRLDMSICRAVICVGKRMAGNDQLAQISTPTLPGDFSASPLGYSRNCAERFTAAG
jgi:hypothetical protein